MSKIVTFDQAVHLKKLGYNKGSYNFYLFDKAKETEDSLTEHGKFDNWNLLDQLNMYIGYATAPTVSEALDFIREEKGIACGAGLNVNSDNRFLGNYIYEYVIDNNKVKGCSEFDTHPLAESALLDSLLDYLEKK